jgi:hypothetical protein
MLQEVAPLPLEVPVEQNAHVDAPLALNLPAAQLEHDVAPAAL